VYAADPRDLVRRAVMDAWRSFEPDEFARRILPRFPPNATSIACDAAFSLEGVEQCRALTSLYLRDCLDNVTFAPSGLER
jgi:hypothetical protein